MSINRKQRVIRRYFAVNQQGGGMVPEADEVCAFETFRR